jgi:uncharacterized protein YycO
MGVTWSESENPRPGDIILAASDGTKWALYATLQLIMGTPSVYTHSALVLGGGMYLDPRPGGAQIRPIESLRERKSVAFSRNPLTDEQRQAIVEVAWDYLDAPYTFWRFGYLAGRTFRWGKKVVSALDKKCGSATICSELLLRVYYEAGVPFAGWTIDPRDASPGTLSRIGVWSHYQEEPIRLIEPPVQLA